MRRQHAVHTPVDRRAGRRCRIDRPVSTTPTLTRSYPCCWPAVPLLALIAATAAGRRPAGAGPGARTRWCWAWCWSRLAGPDQRRRRGDRRGRALQHPRRPEQDQRRRQGHAAAGRFLEPKRPTARPTPSSCARASPSPTAAPFDAAAVKFSFDRAKAPDSKNKAKKAVFDEHLDVSTPDAHTVILSLDRADPTMPFRLGENTAVILHPKTAEQAATAPGGHRARTSSPTGRRVRRSRWWRATTPA
jgi:hypothetical protein